MDRKYLAIGALAVAVALLTVPVALAVTNGMALGGSQCRNDCDMLGDGQNCTGAACPANGTCVDGDHPCAEQGGLGQMWQWARSMMGNGGSCPMEDRP